MFKIVMSNSCPPCDRHTIVLGCADEKEAIHYMEYFYRLMVDKDRYYLTIEKMTSSEINYYKKIKTS